MNTSIAEAPMPAQPGTPEWQVHAVQYATLHSRRSQLFLDGAPQDDGPQNLDYYVWTLQSVDRCIVVDTGCRREIAERRGRIFLRDPCDGIAELGIVAAQVEDVIITHLHYDHAGNLAKFPSARFHLQEREMHFATGRMMCAGPLITGAIEQNDIVTMLRNVFDQRVNFLDGTAEIAPGVQLERTGGHTPGTQAVRVWTKRGWLVLASDGAHLYENMTSGRPFHIVINVPKMVEGWKTTLRLAESRDHVIPGHDPLVLVQYPSARPGLDGIVSLHEPPLFSAFTDPIS